MKDMQKYHNSFHAHIETSQYLQFQKKFYIRKYNFMKIFFRLFINTKDIFRYD